MSRHRIVRAMNYEDEYYDDEEEYSRSVEDNYCISPSTAAQFTWNRERNINFAAYMDSEDTIDEEEEDSSNLASDGSFNDSGHSTLKLSECDQARLNSCLEEIRNILGDTVTELAMKDVIIQNNFNLETSLNQLLSQQDAPKPQRERRQNRRNQLQASSAEYSQNPNSSVTPTIDVSQERERQSKTMHVPSPAKSSTPVLSTPVIKSSKSASKITVGFQEDPEFSAASTPVRSKPTDQIGDGISKDSKAKTDAIQSSKMAHSTGSSKKNNKRDNTPSRVSIQETNVKDGASVLDNNLRSAMENLGIEVDKDVIQTTVDAMKSSQALPTTPKSSKSKSSKLDVMAEYAKRHGDKELLNLVVIGHVDAGKSTLMGHLLYQLGSVNKRMMHKYEQESKKIGKSSFAFAWVLDETEEERTRGVTMDVAQTSFETDKKHITLLDAPGHKDFIPNMITGASQADVAILVINAAKGEFETGFDAGGQTREHALLARSLGVGQIIVAVNKMDMVDWSQERYQLITKKIGQFLIKQAGFKESDVSFVPCSGLSGENLTKKSTVELISWYQPSVTLMEKIDNLHPPPRPIDKPLRLNVSDVFKGIGTGFNIAGRIGSGFVQPGDKALVLPSNVAVNVKSITVDDSPVQVAFAGDHVNITLGGIDMVSVNIGSVLCDPASPSKSAMRIRAKIVIFSIDVPITKGFPVVFHYQSVNEPAIVKRLLSQLNRSTGEVLKNKPRCLTKNSSAVVEIEFERPLCLELYADFKDLGRFMLRSGGHTIAAGLIEEIVQSKTPLNGACQS